MTERLKKINLLLILAIVFVDLLGVGMIVPILPDLFGSNTYFSSLDPAVLKIFYGIVIAAYPIAQLFGAPIFGYLADYFGRKKALILSIIGTAFSYLLFVYSIITLNIYLMVFSRALDGFTGGNIFISQSVIIDMSDEKTRVNKLGMINISLGLGLVLGPFLGGLLSEYSVFGIPNIAMPYLFAFILAALNCIFTIAFLTNTNKHSMGKVKEELHLFSSFEKLYKAIKIKNLNLLFAISYFYSIAFSFFINFFPQYLSIQFKFTPKQIGFISAYIGVWLAIGVVFLLPYLNKKYTHTKNLYLSLFVTAFFLMVSIIPTSPFWFLFILPVIALGMSVVSTNIISIISDQASNEKQGEILGINQSIQAFGTTAPFFGGFLSLIWLPMPIFIASVLIFVAFWIVYYKFKIVN